MKTQDQQLLELAGWVASLNKDNLSEEIVTGILTQRKAGRTNEQCAKYLMEVHRDYLSELLTFNESLGVFFVE